MLEKVSSTTSWPFAPELLDVLDGKRDFNQLINSFDQIEVKKQPVENVLDIVGKLEISQIKNKTESKEVVTQITANNTLFASSNELKVFISEDNTCVLKEVSPNSNTYWFHYL